MVLVMLRHLGFLDPILVTKIRKTQEHISIKEVWHRYNGITMPHCLILSI
jgi:hypothetical protein